MTKTAFRPALYYREMFSCWDDARLGAFIHRLHDAYGRLSEKPSNVARVLAVARIALRHRGEAATASAA
jgi:hypothetical protein